MRTLEQLLAGQSSTFRARGRTYWQQGCVQVVERTEEHVKAHVEGTDLYTVKLERGTRDWKNPCTCQCHADRGQCKHVCAVLLELTTSSKVTAGPARATAAQGAEEVLAIDDSDDESVFNAQLEHLLADRFMPRDLKLQILGRVLNGRVGFGNELLEESEPVRARRLLQTLDANPPQFAAARRSLALRYVLSPRNPSSDAVGIEVEFAKISARGEVGAFRTVRAPPSPSELDEADRMAAAVLIDGPRERDTSYAYMVRPAQLALQPALQRLLLPQLARAQRLFLAAQGKDPMLPLVYDEDGPWCFRIDVESERKGFKLEAIIERAGEHVPLLEVACAMGGGLAIARGKLLSVDWHGARAWAAHLCGKDKLAVPRDQASAIARLLSRAPLSMPVRAEGLVEELSGSPRPVVTVRPPTSGR